MISYYQQKLKLAPVFLTLNLELKDRSFFLRLESERFGGAVVVYNWEDIPYKQLPLNNLPDDIDGIFVEINLRKWSGYYLELTLPLAISRIFSKTSKLCPL